MMHINSNLRKDLDLLQFAAANQQGCNLTESPLCTRPLEQLEQVRQSAVHQLQLCVPRHKPFNL